MCKSRKKRGGKYSAQFSFENIIFKSKVLCSFTSSSWEGKIAPLFIIIIIQPELLTYIKICTYVHECTYMSCGVDVCGIWQDCIYHTPFHCRRHHPCTVFICNLYFNTFSIQHNSLNYGESFSWLHVCRRVTVTFHLRRWIVKGLRSNSEPFR